MEEKKKTSYLLEDIYNFSETDKISMESLITSNKDSSYFLLLLFALFSLIPTPLPIPVISMLFGLILTFITFQLMVGKVKFYLPKKILRFSIKRENLAKFIEKTNPHLKRIEFFTKFRFTFFKNKAWKKFIDILLFYLSFTILIPLPLLNTIPAIGIILICFGIINNDGLIVLFGFIFALLNLTVMFSFILLGKVAIVFLFKLKNNLF